MGDSEKNKQESNRGLRALEAGQVVEIRVRGGEASYWTYIRDVMGTVTVWLPEMNGALVSIEEEAQVELSVTLSDAEILVAAGKVKSSGARGGTYIEVELDAASVVMEHRRRFLRVAAVVPVNLRRMPDGLTPWGDVTKGKTLNLSPGGVTLEAEAGFALGEQLAVELELPDCRVKATGLVLNSSAAGAGQFRLSVRFAYISDQAEAGITRLMYQYQRMHGAARA